MKLNKLYREVGINYQKIKALLKSGIFSDAIRLSGGAVLGNIFVFLTTPILTRLYAPSEWGVFALYMTFINIGTVVVTFRFELAIMSAKSTQEADNLLLLSTLVTFPMGAVCSVLMYIFIKNNLLSMGILPLWTVILCFFTLLGTGIYTTFRCWQIKHREFSLVSYTAITQGATRALSPIPLFWIFGSWAGLVWGELIARCAGNLKMFFGLHGVWRVCKPKLSQIQTEFRLHWRYPVTMMPSSLLDIVGTLLPIPVIVLMFGLREAGEFALITRLISLPVAMFSSALADILHLKFCDIYQKSEGGLSSYLKKITLKLALISVGGLLPIAFAAPHVAGTILGNQWGGGGWLIMVLIPIYCISLVVSTISRILLIGNFQYFKLIYDLISLVLPISGLILFSNLGFAKAMMIYSLAASFCYILYGLIIFYVARRLDNSLRSL